MDCAEPCIKKAMASISNSIMSGEWEKSRGDFLLMCVIEDRCSALDDHQKLKGIPHKLREDVFSTNFHLLVSIEFSSNKRQTKKNSGSVQMLVALLQFGSLRKQKSIYGINGGATSQRLSYFVESEHTQFFFKPNMVCFFLFIFCYKTPTEH